MKLQKTVVGEDESAEKEGEPNVTDAPMVIQEFHRCARIWRLPLSEWAKLVTAEHRKRARWQFINVFSRTRAEGKSTLRDFIEEIAQLHWGMTFKFLCEDKDRPPRAAFGRLRAEEEGRDLVYHPRAKIMEGIKGGEYLIAYETETVHIHEVGDQYEERVTGRGMAGLPVKRVVEAMETDAYYTLTIPPLAYADLTQYIPDTRSLFVVPNPEDTEFYLRTRSLHNKAVEIQRLGWLDDPFPFVHAEIDSSGSDAWTGGQNSLVATIINRRWNANKMVRKQLENFLRYHPGWEERFVQGGP